MMGLHCMTLSHTTIRYQIAIVVFINLVDINSIFTFSDFAGTFSTMMPMEKVEMMDAMITLAGTVVLKVDLDCISKFLFTLKNSQNSLLPLHFNGILTRCTCYMML